MGKGQLQKIGIRCLQMIIFDTGETLFSLGFEKEVDQVLRHERRILYFKILFTLFSLLYATPIVLTYVGRNKLLLKGFKHEHK